VARGLDDGSPPASFSGRTRRRCTTVTTFNHDLTIVLLDMLVRFTRMRFYIFWLR